MTQKTLRLIIVEDSEDDVILLTWILKKGGYQLDYVHVDNEKALCEALTRPDWDLIISDYNMPTFSGLDALAIVKNSGLDIPFIVISGVIGEDVAVDTMRAGAQDYLIKGQLARLIPAIEREIKEAAERKAHKSAERQLRRLSLALEQSASLVMVTDVEGIIEYVNPTFSRVTGFSEDDMIGTAFSAWQSLVTCNEDFSAVSIPEIIHSTTVWSHEIELQTKNGENYWAKISISPIRDANLEITGSLIVQEDITERKYLEMENDQYLNRLEALVEERTRELMATNEQLSFEIEEREQAQTSLKNAHENALAALQLKNQILANMNHEIRTPLSIINNTIYLLNREHYGPMSDDQRQAMCKITNETQHLLEFAENLLSVANRDQNTIADRQILNMKDVVRFILAKQSPKAKEKGLYIESDISEGFPEEIVGNTIQLKRILYNLVDNAIKFTEKGGVNVRLFQPSHQKWAVQVSDTGPGIAPEIQSQIFEPFWQQDGSATRIVGRGVGLGLTVVNKLAALMHGEIQVTSNAEDGTIFTIEFPIQT